MDRSVRGVNLSKEPVAAEFSSYLSVKNIILLGDAGSGKTRLFKDFSKKDGARLLTVRSFLRQDLDFFKGVKTIFIDALDEARPDRKDFSNIDLLVNRLIKLRPEYFRISCRAADWLGASDWNAFNDYFEQSGESVTLHLESLSRPQQIQVLNEQKYDRPERFLSEAESRGLGELLGNPQNLIMLSKVVSEGSWPTLRYELFESFANILLEEHSGEQHLKCSGKYGSSELIDVAGELFAVRLLGDVSAVAIGEKDLAEDVPSYRNICRGDTEKTVAVLNRRVFVSGPMMDTVDYAHRTLAEYLAARWLAGRVRAGLPLTRIQSLINVGECPASELRGLHGWLATHLEDIHANILIASDPWGALIYGDAAKLSARMRSILLEGLGSLSNKEPWFYQGTNALSSIGGLSAGDTIDAFRKILTDADASVGLKIIVLNSLVFGNCPYQRLTPEISSLVLRVEEDAYVRIQAIIVLSNIHGEGIRIIDELYPRLGTTTGDFLVRIACLKRMVEPKFVCQRVLELLRDIHYSDVGVYCTQLWRITDLIPRDEVASALNWMIDAMSSADVHENRVSLPDVHNELGHLLIRALKEPEYFDVGHLIGWLSFRARQRVAGSGIQADDIKNIFISSSSLQVKIIKGCISVVELNTDMALWLATVRNIYCGGLDEQILLEQLEVSLRESAEEKRSIVLYLLALVVVLQIGKSGRSDFDRLYDYSEGNSEWCALRDRMCVCLLSQADQEARAKKIALNRSSLLERQERIQELVVRKLAIESSADLESLIDLVSLYFNRKGVPNRLVGSFEQLVTDCSEEGANSVRLGVLAFLSRTSCLTTEKLLNMYESGESLGEWDVFLAALDQYFEVNGSVLDLPGEKLVMGLVVENLNPVYVHYSGSKCQHVPRWKMELLERRASLVREVYLGVVREELVRGRCVGAAFESLIASKELAIYRCEVAVVLLESYRLLSLAQTRKLLRVLLFEQSGFSVGIWLFNQLVDLAPGAELRILFLVSGVLSSSEDFCCIVSSLEGADVEEFVWEFVELVNVSRVGSDAVVKINSGALGVVLPMIFRIYGRVPYPKKIHKSGRTPEDATSYALKFISILASSTDEGVLGVLVGLLRETSSLAYKKEILQAIAQQNKMKIDNAFRQPGWRKVVGCLSQQAPANMQDFQALVADFLRELKVRISDGNTDTYKRFWNEDSYGKVDAPKNEESCRDYLVELLRQRLPKAYFTVEPEGHMANDKRADIVITSMEGKLILELKRDFHSEVEVSIGDQLTRLYTRDPDCGGYGLFVVFWFGRKRGRRVKKILDFQAPETAGEMEKQLSAVISRGGLTPIQAIVLDVSGEIPELSKCVST